jgi:hypothetical protein
VDAPQHIDRRSLLVGAVAAASAWAATLVESGTAAARRTRRNGAGDPASTGDPVTVGSTAVAPAPTGVNNTSTSASTSALKGAGFHGVYGASNAGTAGSAGVSGSGNGSSYGVLSIGPMGVNGVLELRDQSSSVGTVPSGSVYLYARSTSSGMVLIARFPNGVERQIPYIG